MVESFLAGMFVAVVCPLLIALIVTYWMLED